MQKPIDDTYISSFLKNHNFAILSTVNKDGLPDAAPIYFLSRDNFDIFFVTPSKTQKNTNMDFNNDVVLTITNEATLETVSIRGKASQQEDQLDAVLKGLAEKLNSTFNFVTTLPILKHEDNPKITIKVKPYKIMMRKYADDGLEEKIINI